MLTNRLRNIFILVSLLLLFNNFFVIAMGGYEESYKKAKQLYDDKKYNEAIEVLSKLLKKDSEHMGKAQKILNDIRIAQENYNECLSKLIIAYNENDIEAVSKLIKELEEIDPYPNETSKHFIEMAKKAAGLFVYKNNFTEIMEKAGKEIASEMYDDALATYMSGFNLGLDNFKNSGFESNIVNDVLERSKSMNELSIELISLYNKTQEKLKITNNTTTEDFVKKEVIFKEFFSDATEIRKQFKNIADYFFEQESTMKEDFVKEENIIYLIFMRKLINGRLEVKQIEGIIGTIDLVSYFFYKDLKENAVSLSTELFENTYSSFKKEKSKNIDPESEKIKTIANFTLSMLNFGVDEINGSLWTIEKDINAEKLYIQQLLDVSSEFSDIVTRYKLLKEIEKNYSTILSNERVDNEVYLETMKNILAEIPIVNKKLSIWQEKLDDIKELSSSEKTIKIIEIPINEYKYIFNSLVSMSKKITVKNADVQFENYKKEFEELEETLKSSLDEIDRINENETAEDGIIRIPKEVLKKIKEAEIKFAELDPEKLELDKNINNEDENSEEAEYVKNIKEELAKLYENTKKMLDETKEYNGIAENNEFMAEKLSREGDIRLEEAKELIKQGEYATTRKRLEQAVKKYDESLLYIDNPDLLTRRDDEIRQISDEIRTAENVRVIEEVRKDLEEAKKAYALGDFIKSEAYLLKAQTRWKDTHAEANAEIEYWLSLIRNAITVTAGSIIVLTDPLYVEMNQYLNQAYKDFDEAKKLITMGNEKEAKRYFDKADKSILHVKKFFPINKEANVLKLRINQFENPEKFNEFFGKELDSAKKLISTDPQNAYLQLKNLEAIDADFKGLQSAIIEAEYATGIRVRPPDKKKLEKSTELYNLAYSIVSRNVRSELPLAFSYVEEAISLNPENVEAMRLKDRIATDVGGTSNNILSNADQKLYNEAVREFTIGNYLNVTIIIQKLLQNEENKKNPKILDLQERLEQER